MAMVLIAGRWHAENASASWFTSNLISISKVSMMQGYTWITIVCGQPAATQLTWKP